MRRYSTMSSNLAGHIHLSICLVGWVAKYNHLICINCEVIDERDYIYFEQYGCMSWILLPLKGIIIIS